jgi:hypothetical protein
MAGIGRMRFGIHESYSNAGLLILTALLISLREILHLGVCVLQDQYLLMRKNLKRRTATGGWNTTLTSEVTRITRD